MRHLAASIVAGTGLACLTYLTAAGHLPPWIAAATAVVSILVALGPL